MGGWDTHTNQIESSPSLYRYLNEAVTASIDNDDDAGDRDGNFAGRIIPQISVNQYAATLANWMGVEASVLQSALPDLANFTQQDLGFFR